jgi:starvation-inducible DNA-binding protein
VKDNDADYVTPSGMLAELREDNQALVTRMREAHGVCDEHGDVATASLLEVWIDERSGGCGSSTRRGASSGRVEPH